MAQKYFLRIIIVALISLCVQFQPFKPVFAVSYGYVTLLPGFGPIPRYSESLCSMTVPDRIQGFRVVYGGGNPNFANLRDVIAVPGYGKLLGNPGYQDNGVGGTQAYWEFVVNTSFSVAPNTPITVYTVAYTDDTFRTPFYITKLVFDCTTAAVLSITSGPIGDTSICTFTDGRLNKCNLDQSMAVYCQVDSSINIYAVYQSKGFLAINVTSKEIEAVPTHPAQNTLIKEGNGVRLYRLTTGKLQADRVNANGSDDAFVFDDCP